MTSMPVLLVTSVDGTYQVLVGHDEVAYRRAFSEFVESWGQDAIWFDDEAGLLGSDGGVTMGRWRARWLGRKPMLALVVSVDSIVADVYLVDDAPMARRVALALERPRVGFELVALEPLPYDGELPDEDSFAGAAIRRVAGRGARPPGPRGAFSEAVCDRCEDHPLYVEPLLDATLADGTRVCVACAALASINQGAARRSSSL
jgi:hypothetical protein